MKTTKAIVFITFVLFVRMVPQTDKISFSGVVKDSNNVALPSASIRIAGSNIGTISDRNGKFQIRLTKGAYQIHFSYVGHKSHTVNIQLQNDTSVTVCLIPNEIRLGEVLVSGEDPAYAIIREAIEQKKRTNKYIHSYKARVYTKDTFGTDTALVLISEAYSDLYWNRNDSLKELIVFRRQSSNLPKEYQFAMVNDFINFNSDSIQLWRYTFIGPIADSAFRYYDYKFLHSYRANGREQCVIELIPRSQIVPLFIGTVTIEDSSYALIQVSVHPTGIFTVPFFTIKNFPITQRFSKYDDHYWFPLDYQIAAEMKFQFMGMNIPNSMYYNKSVICFEYQPNVIADDSIRRIPTQSLLPTAETYDTTQWSNVKLFPLSDLESSSYGRIDKIMKESSFSGKTNAAIQKAALIFNMVDIRYNRTEGWYTGGKTSDTVLPRMRLKTKLGYGFSDGRIKYSAHPELLILPAQSLWFGGEVYRRISAFPANNIEDGLLNTVSSFFNGTDYYDYYLRTGNRLTLSYEQFPGFFVDAGFTDEKQRSMAKKTDFSLGHLSDKRTFRMNPAINEGRMRLFHIEFYNREEFPASLFAEPQNRWNVRMEHSSPDYGSSFDFTSVSSSASVRIQTMGNALMFNPYLGISAAAGISQGAPPFQKIFALGSPQAKIVFANTFRTVALNEFMGQNYYAVSAEHNFRNIPFILAGIPSLNADLIVRAAIGKTWTNLSALKTITTSTNGRYMEYSIGVGRLGGVFRFEITYSNYGGSRTDVTLTGGL